MHATDQRFRALRDSLAGQVLRGSGGVSYHLGDRIGEGGQGWVFKANWDAPNGFVVVVKVLRPDSVSHETMERFQREAEVLRMLSQVSSPNPHIVRFFDHASTCVAPAGGGERMSLPFTVLEYVNGPTLEQVLAPSKGFGLPLDRVRRVTRHVAAALAHVHAQKIVHRDLKPSNILLATDAEIAKVTDFGLVKLVDVNLQRTTALAGASLGYAPPEQYEQGNERVGARTDVFSLAAIVFEMLTGKKSFPYKDGENPLLVVTRILNGPRPSLMRSRGSLPAELQQRADLIEKLDAELLRATSADPDGRHASAAELFSAFDAIFRAAAPERRSHTPVRMTPIPGAPFSRISQPPASLDVTLSSAPSPASAGSSHSTHETPIAMSVLEARASNPTAWSWRTSARSVRPNAVRAASFSPEGNAAWGVGPGGLARWSEARGWESSPLPAGAPPGAVRGITWTKDGDVVFYGERSLSGRITGSGAHEIWSVPENDITFLGLHRDDDGVMTLVGERKARGVSARPGSASTVGLVAQFSSGSLTMLSDVPACARLRAATRLRGGPILACGDRGALARLDLGIVEYVGSVCGGHLTAIAAVPEGGALIVGAGGHALTVSPRFEAQLEAVQTTRDLLSLTLSDDGAAWAGAAQARLLRRSSGSWVRMSGDVGVAAGVVAIWAGGRTVRAVCDDGAVIEGKLT